MPGKTGPTTWSFVPAGVVALIALVLFFVWPVTVNEDGHAEMSMWSGFFFAFHLLAAAGCIRGSILFLRRQPNTLPRRAVFLARTFLVLALGSLALWGWFLWFLWRLYGKLGAGA